MRKIALSLIIALLTFNCSSSKKIYISSGVPLQNVEFRGEMSTDVLSTGDKKMDVSPGSTYSSNGQKMVPTGMYPYTAYYSISYTVPKNENRISISHPKFRRNVDLSSKKREKIKLFMDLAEKGYAEIVLDRMGRNTWKYTQTDNLLSATLNRFENLPDVSSGGSSYSANQTFDANLTYGSLKIVTRSNSVIILRNAYLKETSMEASKTSTLKNLQIESKDGVNTTLELSNLKFIEIHKVERASVYAQRIESTVTLKNRSVYNGVIRFAIVEGENQGGNLTTVRSYDIKTIEFP